MPYADIDRQREYQRKWMARRRAGWIAVNGPCTDCGSWADLQIDHVDASTKVSHRIWSWAEHRRTAELAKCVARCNPCHRKKTVAAGETPHGERNAHAKLAAHEVIAIRQSPLSARDMARLFGVHRNTILALRNGRSWKRLKLSAWSCRGVGVPATLSRWRSRVQVPSRPLFMPA